MVGLCRGLALGLCLGLALGMCLGLALGMFLGLALVLCLGLALVLFLGLALVLCPGLALVLCPGLALWSGRVRLGSLCLPLPRSVLVQAGGPGAPGVLAGVGGRPGEVCVWRGCWRQHLHTPRGRHTPLKPEVTPALGVFVH